MVNTFCNEVMFPYTHMSHSSSCGGDDDSDEDDEGINVSFPMTCLKQDCLLLVSKKQLQPLVGRIIVVLCDNSIAIEVKSCVGDSCA